MEEIVGLFAFEAGNTVWRVASLVAFQVGVLMGSKASEGISCLTLSFAGISGFVVSLTGSGFPSVFLGATKNWRGPGCFFMLVGKAG